jgi:LAGLIDADG DNA endonuclease family
MDDGANTTSGSGFYLHTKGFEFNEVYLLAGIMHYKFDIYCTVQSHKNRPVLYITSKSKTPSNLLKLYILIFVIG